MYILWLLLVQLTDTETVTLVVPLEIGACTKSAVQDTPGPLDDVTPATETVAVHVLPLNLFIMPSKVSVVVPGQTVTVCEIEDEEENTAACWPEK
jgi:hypothetical protein